jgi:hypothetical protein
MAIIASLLGCGSGTSLTLPIDTITELPEPAAGVVVIPDTVGGSLVLEDATRVFPFRLPRFRQLGA